MEMINGLPLITLTGDAHQRGTQHGQQLRDSIHKMIEIYGAFFGRPEAQIFEIAAHFKSVITEFNSDYAIEIEAIAAAAEVNPLWIYALNARSEFLSYVPATECTLMHFEGTPLLGQNWDWEERLEPLISLVRIERSDAPTILMMTEPGIIGKIGLNTAGIGVCFNFLLIDRPTNGVPIHVLLRAVLDCSSLEEARQTIDKAGNGRSANIMVADKDGNRFDIEFASTEQFEIPDNGDILAHTNHYLDRNMFSLPEVLENSTTRYDRVMALASQTPKRDRSTMEAVLSDTENPGDAICQPYRMREPLGNMGTVCTLTMNLSDGDMAIRLGNDATKPLAMVSVLPSLETQSA